MDSPVIFIDRRHTGFLPAVSAADADCREIACLCRAKRGLSCLYAIVCFDEFPAVFLRHQNGLFHGEVKFRFREILIQRVQRRIHRDTHDVVQVRFCNITGVVRCDALLLRIGERYIGRQYVQLSHDAGIELLLYVIQMACIVSDRLCLHFSELDRFKVLVVCLHGRELRIRFCFVDIKICDVFLIACGIDRTFYLAEGPDVPGNIDPLTIAMVGALRSCASSDYLCRILISLPGVADGRILLRCRCADIGFRFSSF